MSEDQKLRLALPKGSLQNTTIEVFKRAGYSIRVSDRSYYPSIDDSEIECILIRPQEMARYIEQGVMDCGITGRDWVLESGADVAELADLKAPLPNYVPVRWVLAVKEDSAFRTPRDLEGMRIATEVMGLTKSYLAQEGFSAQLEFSWGATEVKPPILADAIVDVTETGSSLKANSLRVIDVVLESTPRFVANHAAAADPWKRAKMDRMLTLLSGVIAATTRVGLSMNVPRDCLDQVLALLPKGSPTLSPLADESWVDVFVIIEQARVREILPSLHEAGARVLVETALSKIID